MSAAIHELMFGIFNVKTEKNMVFSQPDRDRKIQLDRKLAKERDGKRDLHNDKSKQQGNAVF